MSEPLTAESWAMAHGLTEAEVVAARAAIERGDMVMFSPDVAERLLDAVRDRPGLDVERLADALHDEQQCDFGYCEGRVDHIDKAQRIATEYARLAAQQREGAGS